MCRRDCKRSGLEIRSSVFWSNRSSFVIERSIDRFNLEKDRQERIDHVNLLKRSKIEESDSIFWHKRGENCQKHMNRSFFVIDRSTRSWKWSNRSLEKDRQDRFNHGRSFLKIEKIERLKIEGSKDRIPNPANGSSETHVQGNCQVCVRKARAITKPCEQGGCARQIAAYEGGITKYKFNKCMCIVHSWKCA